MGLRSLAGRVVKKLLSRPDRPAEPPRAEPPRHTPRTPAPPAAAPSPGANLANIDCGPQELKERLDAGEQIVVLDVRTADEVAGGALPTARHIPLDELEDRWEELSGADEIVCYCAAGMRSLRAARILRAKGLINATSLEGGIQAWMGIGGAVVKLS